MGSTWRVAKGSSLCEITTLRVEVNGKKGRSVPTDPFQLAMACEKQNPAAVTSALDAYVVRLAPLLETAVADLLPPGADTVNIRLIDGGVKVVKVSDVAQEVMYNGLFFERVINNPTCTKREVDWRALGLKKTETAGCCLLMLASAIAAGCPAGEPNRCKAVASGSSPTYIFQVRSLAAYVLVRACIITSNRRDPVGAGWSNHQDNACNELTQMGDTAAHRRPTYFAKQLHIVPHSAG